MRGRFRDAVSVVRAANLYERIVSLLQPAEPGQRLKLARDYFRLGLPCPFLEDESCGIHEHRPLACREYLVTSDPAECAVPGRGRIDGVAVPTKLSVLLNDFRTVDGAHDTPSPVPLITALEWSAKNAPAKQLFQTGPRLLEHFVSKLAPATTQHAGSGSAIEREPHQ